MAKRRRRQVRKRYTREQRERILAAANRGKLTAPEVEKRFGVKPVTFYLWRMNAKRAGGGVRGQRKVLNTDSVVNAVRTEIRKHVRAMLPGIVREETRRYLAKALD